jgi:hypothetical protein
MKKKRKWILFGSLGLLILFVISIAFATHGGLWSIYIPIYERLLNSLPSPPGLLPESIDTTLAAYHPCGGTTYNVDNEHVATIDFFVTELPRSGWRLVEHESQDFEITLDKHIKVDEMVFANRQKYWLGVKVRTSVYAEGARTDDSMVFLNVCRNARRHHVVGFPENE